MVLPLLLLLLSAFALRPVHHPAMAMAVAAAAPIAVIIDAGHGGIDAGAVVDHVNEKDIALSLAQKVKALAPQYNVRVIMTRETDELPGGATNIQAGLRKRTEIANQAGAAMFISLHVNQSDGLPQPAGFDAYIAAGKEDKKNQLLASTLLQQLGSVYTVAPDIKKRSEKSIWVLEQNPRPAVLLECGNLSIPADKEFITNEKNQENVAKMILRGIVNYSKL
jgi:N-acetylmuramoyl-L-alanine amidase